MSTRRISRRGPRRTPNWNIDAPIRQEISLMLRADLADLHEHRRCSPSERIHIKTVPLEGDAYTPTSPPPPTDNKALDLLHLCSSNGSRKLNDEEAEILAQVETRVDAAMAGEGNAFDILKQLSKAVRHTLKDRQRFKLRQSQRRLDQALRIKGKEKVGNGKEGLGSVPAVYGPAGEDPIPLYAQQVILAGSNTLTLPPLNVTPETAQFANNMMVEVNSLLLEQYWGIRFAFSAPRLCRLRNGFSDCIP